MINASYIWDHCEGVDFDKRKTCVCNLVWTIYLQVNLTAFPNGYLILEMEKFLNQMMVML